MPIELKIPPVGESITEVEIGQWLKREGEQVRADEPVVELVTDKATLELPAPASGVLSKILIPSGQARVGDVVALLEEQEVQAAEPAAQAAPKPQPAPSSPSAAEAKVMPAAARLAAQSGVDVASLKGSGPGGRVLKEDVQKALSTPA
ncbi:biotin/lipoyl-containing protein, partial [Meiothermus luteus]|uniref:biotin/lipoyl-containing protein n=1 Tax=Meiothermus luteus TaxID=2026184 RepID=UPI0015FDA06F